MDEGKFVADFINANLKSIIEYARNTYGKIDETIQIKLKTAYKDYLNQTRSKYSKSKSFFIRSQAVDLYEYYEPTGIHSDSVSISEPSITNCLEKSNKVVISGTGGCGKTVLMKHLFLDCIASQKYAPIMVELRDINHERTNLLNFIKSTLDEYSFNVEGDYIEKAMKAGHFALFLDGFDEVAHAHRKKLISEIKSIATKYKKCPIIVSTRPDDTFNGIDEFIVFSVLPLRLQSAISLIEKLPYDKEVKSKFAKHLEEGLFLQHESFLSNPLLLSIMLLTYGENAQIPSKLSIFYNQAYEALFQRHDANKGGYSRSRLTELDIQDFARVFSLFCLQTYDKRQFKMSRSECLDLIEKSRDKLCKDFKPEDYLSDLLSAACLMIEDGLEIAFSHRSFQEYFVAVFISNASPEIQKKLINRYLKNIRSDNVINLLLEIAPDLVERELMIPHLAELFRELKVKKKVGITHTVKFFKETYSELIIEPDRIGASYKKSEAGPEAVVALAVQHTNSYQFPDNDYFEAQNAQIHDKYSESENHLVTFHTHKLTYRSEVLRDIMYEEGAFSIKFLQSAHDAYLRLKQKHQNAAQSLDDLLI
jgi:predicted NACHT family NTPase